MNRGSRTDTTHTIVSKLYEYLGKPTAEAFAVPAGVDCRPMENDAAQVSQVGGEVFEVEGNQVCQSWHGYLINVTCEAHQVCCEAQRTQETWTSICIDPTKETCCENSDPGKCDKDTEHCCKGVGDPWGYTSQCLPLNATCCHGNRFATGCPKVFVLFQLFFCRDTCLPIHPQGSSCCFNYFNSICYDPDVAKCCGASVGQQNLGHPCLKSKDCSKWYFCCEHSALLSDLDQPPCCASILYTNITGDPLCW